MPSAQKPAGAEDAERALSRDQPVAADAAAPTPANQGSASAAGAEFTDEDLQQDPLGNGDLLWRVRAEVTVHSDPRAHDLRSIAQVWGRATFGEGAKRPDNCRMPPSIFGD